MSSMLTVYLWIGAWTFVVSFFPISSRLSAYGVIAWLFVCLSFWPFVPVIQMFLGEKKVNRVRN